MDDRIALSLVTGFLGAGKTTLINRLLKDRALADTAVIVNEFGAVSIDHLLVEQASDGVIELSDGCLCCTVRGALVDTLADLGDRLVTGRMEQFQEKREPVLRPELRPNKETPWLKRVVVETTGLADPIPLLHALAAHPGLSATFRLDGVITVVDAVHGLETLESHEEARRQVAVADRLVVTKRALSDAAELERLTVRLRALAPDAPLLEAEGVEVAALINCGAAGLSGRLGGATARHHDDHDDHHHHSEFTSIELLHEEPLPRAAVENFLDLLRSRCGAQILRLKGIVETLEEPERPLVVHGVRQLLHPPQRLAAWPDGARGARLVVIGTKLDADYVRGLFAAFTGAVRVDTPDRAALEENPLAITGFRG